MRGYLWTTLVVLALGTTPACGGSSEGGAEGAGPEGNVDPSGQFDPDPDDDLTPTVSDPMGPLPAISRPETNQIWALGEQVVFEASVEDPDDDPAALVVTWRSDLDGPLGGDPPSAEGTIAFVYGALSVGSHLVTLEVSDPAGNVGEARVRVNVATPDNSCNGASGADCDAAVEELFGDFGAGWEIEGDPEGQAEVSGQIDEGPLAGTEVSGTSDNGQWCVSGSKTFDLGPIVLENATVTICKGDPIWTLEGTLSILGGKVGVSGTFDSDAPWTLTVGADAVDLFGLPFETLEVSLKAGDLAATLTAAVIVGSGASAATLTAVGSVDKASMGLSVSLGGGGGNWTPFADVPGAPAKVKSFAFDEVSGSIDKASGGPISASITLSVGGSSGITLIDGVWTLDDVTATASIDSAGSWSFGLGAASTFDFAGTQVGVSVAGEVSGPVLRMTGTVTNGATYEAGADFLDGGFPISMSGAAASLVADVEAGEVEVQVDAEATLSLPPLDDLTTTFGVRAAFGKGQPAVTVAALLDELSIDTDIGEFGLGEEGFVAVVVSNESVDGFELDADGDPDNGVDWTRDVEAGVSIIGVAQAPAALTDLFPAAPKSLELSLHVGTNKTLRIEGAMGVEWTLLQPGTLPTVDSFTIDKLGLRLEVFKGGMKVWFGGGATFVPTDRAGTPMPLNAETWFGFTSSGSIAGMAFLNGFWREPLHVPDIAILNPAVELALKPTVPPVPTSIGFNGDFMYKNEGAWPATIELVGGVPEIPDNLTSIGGSFFYDEAVSESGICFAGNCAQTPPVLFRLQANEWSLSKVFSIMSSLATSMLDFADGLTGFLPTQSLEVPDIGETDLEIHEAVVYLSTHDLNKWGIDFAAGLRAGLDATVTTFSGDSTNVRFDGSLLPAGAVFDARMDAIELFEGFQVVGDPFEQVLVPGSGGVEVPDAADFDTFGTVEMWVSATSLNKLLSNQGTLAAKRGASGPGWALHIGKLAPACDDVPECGETDYGCQQSCAGSPDPNCYTPVGECGDVDEAGRLRLVVESASGEERVVETVRGVIVDDGRWHHVAVTATPGFEQVKIYVDGSPQALTDSAPGVAPGDNSQPLTIGHELKGAIDEVRVWSVPKSAPELGYSAQTAGGEGQLIRLAFDYDLGETAFSETPGKYHLGTYVGSAQPMPEDAPIFFRVQVDFNEPLNSGLYMQLGGELDLPIPAEIPFPKPLEASLKAFISKDSVAAEFAAREMEIFAIEDFGRFVITGKGPNQTEGDHDDGLYGGFDLLGNPPQFAASGKLLFEPTDPDAGGLSAMAAGYFGYQCQKVGCADVGPNCCSTGGTGCADLPSVESCVCAADSYCCNTQWDQLCVDEVDSLGCGTCKGLSYCLEPAWIDCTAPSDLPACFMAGGADFYPVACGATQPYELLMETDVSISYQLPMDFLSVPGFSADQLKAFELQGSAKMGSYDGAFAVNGSLSVLGRTLASAAITLLPTQIRLFAELEIGEMVQMIAGGPSLSALEGIDFGTVGPIDITLDFGPGSVDLCMDEPASETLTIPGIDANISGTLDVCLGSSPKLDFSGSASSGKILGIELAAISVVIGTTTGVALSASVDLFGVIDGSLSGWFKGPSNFGLQGSGSANFNGHQIAALSLDFSPGSFGVAGNLSMPGFNANMSGSVSASGVTMSGSFLADSGPVSEVASTVLSKVVKYAEQGWNCVSHSATSCGEKVVSGLTSVGECIGGYVTNWCCVEEVLGQCVVGYPCYSCTVPDFDCLQCTKVEEKSFSLGSFKVAGGLTASAGSGTSLSGGIAGAALCKGGSCTSIGNSCCAQAAQYGTDPAACGGCSSGLASLSISASSVQVCIPVSAGIIDSIAKSALGSGYSFGGGNQTICVTL